MGKVADAQAKRKSAFEDVFEGGRGTGDRGGIPVDETQAQSHREHAVYSAVVRFSAARIAASGASRWVHRVKAAAP